MNKYFTEKGYALIVVLLTITMIFSVAGVLGMQAITSAKQINYSDDYVRLIDLAEMGSTYANASIDKSLTKFVIAELEDPTNVQDRNNDGTVSDDEKTYYLETIVSNAANSVVSEVSTTEDGITVDEDSKFRVDVSIESTSASEVVFNVTSIGDNDEFTYPIYYTITASVNGSDVTTDVKPVSCNNGSAEVVIDDNSFNTTSEFDNAKNEISDGGLSYIDVPGTISSDISFPTCTNHNSSLDISNGANVNYEGSVKVSSTANIDSGSTITVNGNYYGPNGTIFGESDDPNKVVGYFNGYTYMNNLTMNNNVNVEVNSNMQVDNQLTIKDGATLTVKNSLLTQNFQGNNYDYNMNIGGNYLVSSNFSQNNGAISVNGDFTSPSANIDGGTMTIYGDMNVQNSLNLNGGQVVVYGDLNLDTNFMYNNYKPDNLPSSKVIPFDDQGELEDLMNEYGNGKIYWYQGVSNIIAPPINISTGGSGSGDGDGTGTGGTETEGGLNIEQGDVEYMGQEEK